MNGLSVRYFQFGIFYCSSKQDEHMTYHNWARQCPTA